MSEVTADGSVAVTETIHTLIASLTYEQVCLDFHTDCCKSFPNSADTRSAYTGKQLQQSVSVATVAGAFDDRHRDGSAVALVGAANAPVSLHLQHQSVVAERAVAFAVLARRGKPFQHIRTFTTPVR